MTIRRLLHHLSGIPDLYETRFERKLLRLSRHPTNRDVIRLLASLGCPMSTTAGRFSYSNTGYDLLGSVIERVSGQSYRAFFRANLFAPLAGAHVLIAGSRTARAPPMRHRLREEARGFLAQPEHALDGICGSGSIYSTVADLVRYEAALAARRLVSDATMRVALRSGIRDNGTPTGYGFGWNVEPDYVEHSGEWIGFTSHLRRYRRRRLSVYVLSNTTGVDPERMVNAAARAFW